jgi:hypothetical protein
MNELFKALFLLCAFVTSGFISFIGIVLNLDNDDNAVRNIVTFISCAIFFICCSYIIYITITTGGFKNNNIDSKTEWRITNDNP